MGDIGPTQQRYDVLPGGSFGIEDADAWTVPPQATVPMPPEPGPAPTPEPGPYPGPEPVPNPEPPR
jgi:hypothetical protein